MQKSSLPSKQFLIRGGIATAIVALILIVQTEWFLTLFNKKPKQIDPNLTIGDAIAKDSNGNGIPDWEERLWGLDPTELYTGDMSNKEIIDNKKRALGLTVEGEEDLNETDRLARQLFSISASLGQEGASLDDMGNAGAALGDSVEKISVATHYNYKNVRTIPTSRTSLQTYHQKAITLSGKYSDDAVNIDTVITAINDGNYSELPQLLQTAAQYKAFAQELNSLSVPVGVAQAHLTLINGLHGMAEALTYVAQLDENPIVGMKGLSIYKQYSDSYDLAGESLNIYLQEYGILQ